MWQGLFCSISLHMQHKCQNLSWIYFIKILSLKGNKTFPYFLHIYREIEHLWDNHFYLGDLALKSTYSVISTRCLTESQTGIFNLNFNINVIYLVSLMYIIFKRLTLLSIKCINFLRVVRNWHNLCPNNTDLCAP